MALINKLGDTFVRFKNKIQKKRAVLEKKTCIDFSTLPEEKKTIDLGEIVTFELVFRFWIAILFVVYIGYIAASSLDIIYAIFTAFIISMAVESIILFLSNFFNRPLSIILAYVFLFIFLTLGFVILIPFLLSNFSQIIDIMLQKISALQAQLQSQSISDFIKSLHLYPYLEHKLLLYLNNPEIAQKVKDIIWTNISNILQTFGWYVKDISSLAINAISWFFSAISYIVMVFTLAIFFSFEKEKVVYTLANLSKTPKRTATKLKKLYYQLGEWLKGQMLLGLFIWLAVYLGLWTLSLVWLDLPNKGTLALIAWLMEFIPYLGPILGSLPALLVWALTYWFSWFLWVGVLFVIVQQIEWWIVPIIMNKALGVSPLLIVIAMLFGMKIMGFVWIILAIPLAVIVSLLFEDRLDRKSNLS